MQQEQRPMQEQRPIADRLRRDEPIIGFKFTQPGVIAPEQVARLGYDYLFLDLQHGSFDHADSIATLAATTAGGSVGFARVPAADPWWIGRVLDAGAEAVVVPLIESAEDAASVVAACRYPPRGQRSYGPLRARALIGPSPSVANDRVLCVVMVETTAGLDSVDEIASTPGVDAVYVGLSDLTVSLGYEPRSEAGEADVADALKRVLEATNRAGIAAGVACTSGEQGRWYLSEGFRMVTVGGDLNAVVAAARRDLSAARGE